MRSDEEALAEAVLRRLERLGYDVTVENDPVRALELLRMAPEKFHLVITDYSMPVLTGLDLIREASRLRFVLPVVLFTGYLEDLPVETLAEVKCLLVRKRVTIEKLAEAVREAVESSSR